VSPPLDQQLENMIRNLVDDQESVLIKKTITDHSAHFEVRVHNEDVGKLLGRKGIHANSIRRLWEAAYGKVGRGFNLHIVDPRRRNRSPGFGSS
tara:strand:+ start:623 stop:904 length:282 start_codon:yes stop_codon:yes gene_type:complete